MALTRLNNRSISAITALPTSTDISTDSLPSGSIVTHKAAKNSTRAVYDTQYIPFFSGVSFVKKYNSSTSYCVVNALCMSKKTWSFANNWFIAFGSTDFHGVGGWTDTANSSTNANEFTRGTMVKSLCEGISAGTHSISVYMYNYNGGSLQLTVNPNSSDDGRYNQQVSTIEIIEVLY